MSCPRHLPRLTAALIATGIVAATLGVRAELPGWLRHVEAGGVQDALFRTVPTPAGPVEVRRAPADAREALTRLPGVAADRELLALRARLDEEQLDGEAAEVDWKAYAREAPLLVKEYSPAGSELHLFDFAQLTDPDTEARLSQLARWVVDAEAHGERYGVVLPGVLLRPDRGPEHRHRCLAALAVFGIDDRR